MKNTDPQILVEFGAHLQKLRESRNLSLRKLSSQCNVGFSSIGKIEKGQLNITLTTLIELATGLGVHPKKLLDFYIIE